MKNEVKPRKLNIAFRLFHFFQYIVIPLKMEKNVMFVKMIDSAFQVIFQALRGISYRGDIALDDIRMSLGACKQAGKIL